MTVILFDLEGTLVRTIEEDQEAIREFRTKIRKALVELGIPRNELEGLRRATLMRNKAVEYVEEHFTERQAERFHRGMDRFLWKYELSWANDSRIFPDTLPALRELKRLGYRMGVVTNTSRQAASRELSMHEIEAFFETVVTRDEVRRLKPDPEGILLALGRLNARAFFFVGDMVHDSYAAENAGGTSIIVGRRFSGRPRFHADYVVKSLIEVPRLVKSVTVNKAQR